MVVRWIIVGWIVISVIRIWITPGIISIIRISVPGIPKRIPPVGRKSYINSPPVRRTPVPGIVRGAIIRIVAVGIIVIVIVDNRVCS